MKNSKERKFSHVIVAMSTIQLWQHHQGFIQDFFWSSVPRVGIWAHCDMEWHKTIENHDQGFIQCDIHCYL